LAHRPWRVVLSLLGQPIDLRPEFLEALGSEELLDVAASTEVRVQFLGDQVSQHIEAIVTFAVLVALECQKLLGRERPGLPFPSLSNDGPASTL
jgi:hypothetical protein